MINFTNKAFNGKTYRIDVTGHNNIYIGLIRFYPQWRKYCFFPAINTLYDETCLDNIGQELKKMNENRKETKG